MSKAQGSQQSSESKETDDLTARLGEIQAGFDAAIAALTARVEALESGTLAKPAPAASAASFDAEAYPAGMYVLKPGASFAGVIDHPLKDITFREGLPHEIDPAKDTWLQVQIQKGLIGPWKPAKAADDQA